MNMVYNTNALLSLARLPYHFWDLLNPTEDPRDNPGTSIMSYIVSKSLMLESSALIPALGDNFKKILDFSNQRDNICEVLKDRVRTIATVLTNYNGDDRYWQIAINGSLSLDKIKTKIDEIIIKMSISDANDFSINDELIHVKLEIEQLKMVLNDAGILFEWENSK
jgi:hypothetical protein